MMISAALPPASAGVGLVANFDRWKDDRKLFFNIEQKSVEKALRESCIQVVILSCFTIIRIR